METQQDISAVLAENIVDIGIISTKHQESLKHNEEKVLVLENLKNIDLVSVNAFFENLQKKLDDLKAQATNNYNANYNSVVRKINENTAALKTATEVCNTTIQKLNDLQTNVEKNPDLGQFIQRDTIAEMALSAKKPVRTPLVDEELEKIFSKEEIFSEIGSWSGLLAQLESRLAYFVSEHLSSFVSEQAFVTRKEETVGESVDDQLSRIERAKNPAQILDDNFTEIMEGVADFTEVSKPLALQIRYSSNEIYTFDPEEQKFGTYELFISSEYKTPFTIFNNCGSSIWKNQLVFFFGGEDPSNKDKTSNRVFCTNIEAKNEINQLVVKEIPNMLFKKQEFSLATLNDSIYLISGYDMNLPKERRVTPKCERLHIKSRRFYEVRDINYPRQWSSCHNHSNTHLYVFAGQNPKYMNNFVEKIEKYMVHLNDWSVLKYTILDDFLYEPGTKMGIFKAGEQEIVLLGGDRDGEAISDYYVFDTKKYMFVKRRPKFLKEEDNFANRNDIVSLNNKAYMFSGCFANRVYKVDTSDRANYNFSLETQSIFD